MNLKLYYFDQCPFCQIVLRKIDDLDIKESIEFKNILTDPSNRTKHIETTGRSTVPSLYINEKPMFESSDIIHWLEQNIGSIRK